MGTVHDFEAVSAGGGLAGEVVQGEFFGVEAHRLAGGNGAQAPGLANCNSFLEPGAARGRTRTASNSQFIPMR